MGNLTSSGRSRTIIALCTVAILATGALVSRMQSIAAGADGPPLAIAEVKPAAPLDFGKDIQPILRANCLACHNQKSAKGDLILETPDGIKKGGENGPAALAGKGDESLLLKAASHRWESVMPPKSNKVGAEDLTPTELGTLKVWIDQGMKGTGIAHAGPTDWQALPPGLNPIYSVALSNDGQYAVCSRANQIFVYHVPSRVLVTRLTDPALAKINGDARPGIAHRDMVESLAFSPDGKLLASGSFREVKLWRRPEPSVRATVAEVGTNSVTCVAASANGNRVAVAGDDNLIRLCDPATGQTLKTLKGHEGPVSAMQFSADGAKLYSASADKSVRIWNAADGKEIGRIESPAALRDIALVNNDTQFVTTADEDCFRIWSTPIQAKAVDGLSGPISTIVMTTDKKKAAIASPDGKVTLVELPSLKAGKIIAAHSGAIRSMGFTADGTRLMTAGDDKRLIVWDLAKGTAPFTLRLDAPIVGAAIRGDGKQGATSTGNGNVILWDLADLPSREFGEANESPITVAAMSPNNQSIAVGGVSKGKPVVLVRDVASGKITQTLSGHDGTITAIAFSADGARVVTGSADKTARVWTIADGKEVAKFHGHAEPVTAVLLPNASLAISAAGSSVKSWTIADGKPAREIAGPTGAVCSLSALAGGTQVIIASADKALKIFDPSTGAAVRSIDLAGGIASAAAVSKDATLIAVATADKKIAILKAGDGTIAATIDAGESVGSLCFNADASRLLSVGAKQVGVWSVTDGARMETVATPGATFGLFGGALPIDTLSAGTDKIIRSIPTRSLRRIAGLTKPVTQLAYSVAGDVIYTAGSEGIVRAFTSDSGTPRFQTAAGSPIVDMKLSGADGGWLATAGEDKTVKLWDARNGAPSSVPLVAPINAPLRSVAFSTDNKRLFASDSAGGMYAFAVEPIQNQKGPFIGAYHDLPSTGTTAIACVGLELEKFPAGGDIVLSACADKTIRTWRPGLQRMVSAGGGATAVRSMPTQPGQFLVGMGTQVFQYDAKTGAQIRGYGLPAPVSGIAMSLDGKKVAAVGGNVGRVWDATNGQELAALTGDRTAVETVQTQERWAQYADSEIQFWKNQITELNQRQTAETASIARATDAMKVAMTDLPVKEKAFGDKTALKMAAEKKSVDAKAALAKAAADREAAEQEMLATAKAAKTLDENLPAILKVSQAAQEESQIATQKAKSVKATNDNLTADLKQKAQALLNAKSAADSKPADADLAKAVVAAQKVADEATKSAAISAEDYASASKASDLAVAKAKTAANAYVEAQKVKNAASDKSQAAAQARNTSVNMLDQRTNEMRDSENRLRDAKSENARAQAAFEQAQLAVSSSAKSVKASQDSLDKAKKDTLTAGDSQTAAEAASVKAKADLELARKSAVEAQKKIVAVAFARDGGLVITGGEDGAVRTWSAATGAFADTLRAHAGPITCLAVGGDGAILSGSADRSTKIWDTKAGWALVGRVGTGDEKSILSDRVMSLAFTPNSAQLAIGGGVPSRTGELKLWNLAEKTVAKEFVDAHSDTVYSLSFSGDGRYLASGSADKFVKVWNMPPMAIAATQPTAAPTTPTAVAAPAVVPYSLARAFEGHTHHVLGVSFRYDGRTLMSAGADSVVKAWDMVTGEQRGATPPESLGKMEATSIHFIGFTETALLTTGQGVMKMLRDQDGQTARDFDRFNTFLYCGATTPDGQVFAVGGDDSVLHLRDGRDGRLLADFRSPDEPLPVAVPRKDAERAAAK